jgi:peptidoglycan hydrolase FlgJ
LNQSISAFEEGIKNVAVILPAGALSSSSHLYGPAAALTPRGGVRAGGRADAVIRAFDGFGGRAGAAGLASTQASAPAAHSPFAQFEALVLQTFIQAMLPKNAESVYGKGLSGDMWQSMLAQKIAEQVAQRGGVGIAARLAEDSRRSAGQ